MDTNTLIGIITGALGTMVITKIFDYFSEKRVFKRELKRQFFAKKLEAAEKATKFYISGNHYFDMLRTSFVLFINDGDMAYISKLESEAIAKCKSLWDTELSQIALLNLYFDEPKPISWYPADNQSKIADYLSDFLKRDIILINDMKQIATELIKCIDFEQKRSAYYTKIIRDELKKYDT